MIWQWWAFFVALGLVVASLLTLFLGDRDWPIAVLVWSGIAAFVFLMIGSIIGLSRHYGRITCRNFAVQTGRETKFVIYNSWATGDCLTPDGNGHWIPTSGLREFGSKP